MGLFLGHNAPLITPPPSGGYGYLYNFFSASDANFAPTDWKVPTYTELGTLITTLGGTAVAGLALLETGTDHWNSPNDTPTNSSGFTSLGAGFRVYDTGIFNNFKEEGSYWSSTSVDANTARQFYTYRNVGNVGRVTINKKMGYSIRLLYIGAGTPATVTDYDGNVYDTVVIGTQRFTVQNWKCTKLNNGTDIPDVTDNSAWAALTTLARCKGVGDV